MSALLEVGVAPMAEDLKLLEEKFASLSFKDQKKVYMQTLAAGANVLKRETKKNLKNINVKSGRLKASKEMVAGVKSRIVIRSSSQMYGVVHILGDYRLRWFELGTEPRLVKKKRKVAAFRYSRGNKNYLSKPRFTGEIDSYLFFQRAQDSTRGRIFKNQEKTLAEKIEKVWNAASIKSIRMYRGINKYKRDSQGGKA